jgi:hypothetical protein
MIKTKEFVMIGRTFMLPSGDPVRVKAEFGRGVYDKVFVLTLLTKVGENLRWPKSEFINQYKTGEIYELKTEEEITIAKLG